MIKSGVALDRTTYAHIGAPKSLYTEFCQGGCEGTTPSALPVATTRGTDSGSLTINLRFAWFLIVLRQFFYPLQQWEVAAWRQAQNKVLEL